VGIFGSIIETTNVSGILKLNVLATDFFHDKAYPTFLYYNPYTSTKTVSLKIGKGKKVNLYNTVSGRFIAKNVTSTFQIKLSPVHAAVIVIVPANGKISYSGSKMFVNGIVVDYMVKPRTLK
jgi:hypothetical protein